MGRNTGKVILFLVVAFVTVFAFQNCLSGGLTNLNSLDNSYIVKAGEGYGWQGKPPPLGKYMRRYLNSDCNHGAQSFAKSDGTELTLVMDNCKISPQPVDLTKIDYLEYNPIVHAIGFGIMRKIGENEQPSEVYFDRVFCRYWDGEGFAADFMVYSRPGEVEVVLDRLNARLNEKTGNWEVTRIRDIAKPPETDGIRVRVPLGQKLYLEFDRIRTDWDQYYFRGWLKDRETRTISMEGMRCRYSSPATVYEVPPPPQESGIKEVPTLLYDP